MVRNGDKLVEIDNVVKYIVKNTLISRFHFGEYERMKKVVVDKEKNIEKYRKLPKIKA